MKILLSKKQWESIGKKAGWMRSAGGWGHISEEMSDSMEAQVLIKGREGKSIGQIAADIKIQFADMLKTEPMTDQEIIEFVTDTYRMWNHVEKWNENKII